jgi:hypothetical protein
MDLMNAFRTKAYVGHRGHGVDTSDAELTGLYNKLGDVTADNIDTKMTALKSELAAILGVNPALIQSLFNQITGWEQFYANIDDARSQNFTPTTEYVNYYNFANPIVPTRNLAYIDDLIRAAEQRAQH